jgi:ornithine cyclodeaminase/alanine dehydrogenase-like protein (mu-crystallin family)
MPLFLSQDDLRPLFTSPTFYPQLFQVIRDALLRQQDDRPGVVSWLAFPTAMEQQQINLHLLTTPVEGTSVRIFPHRVGAQARDSMFTLLFNDQDGSLLALISLDDLGPLRTAAPVACAAEYLAPRQADTLALLGSGLQARYHLLGLRHALPELKQVRVYSPTVEHRQHFAMQMQTEIGGTVVAVDSAQQALEGADVIAVTAASQQPIFASSDVRPGALVTSIASRAVPPDLAARARVMVPALVGPRHHPSGWNPFPFQLNGGRDPSTVSVTLVDLLHNRGAARQREEEIVLYLQSGSFAWDGAMVRWLYDWAMKQHVGTTFAISTQERMG